MRVDALLAVAAAVLASALLLHFYSRATRAYTLAFDCYSKALEVANLAAQNLTLAGWSSVKPPTGYRVILHYPDGRTLATGTGGDRCYAYTLTGVNGTLLLLTVRS
ncbi:MAG: hypothetical protein QXJ21_05495 [Thermofilum sp.]